MRLIFIAGIPGLDLEQWVTDSLELARPSVEGLAKAAVIPVVVEDFFSMSAIGRGDEPAQRLSNFLDLPPDDLNRVCFQALTDAVDKACSSSDTFGVVCIHPVLHLSETRSFLAPYSSAALKEYLATKVGVEPIFFSLHDDIYDVCRRLQGETRKGDLHIFHPSRIYETAEDQGSTLARDPLRDIQNLLFLLDWRDRELMTSQTLAASVPCRHILFHRKGRASVFWNIAINDAPAVYFSHPISQARRDLTGKANAKKSRSTNRERGRKLMDACNTAAGKLAAEHVPLIEPTSIDEYRLDRPALRSVSAKTLKQCFLPPLTPRWTLTGDRIGLPDGWSERDHLTSFSEKGLTGVKWTSPTMAVRDLGPALDILEHEIVRQITERDHKLTQQAELVVAYRPYSLPDQPVMTGGVKTEIMAMVRKASAGKPCCRPAIIVIHSREDEFDRRRKEFERWWLVNRDRWFKGLPNRGRDLKHGLESLVTNLDETADKAKAKHAVVSLLEHHRALPVVGVSDGKAAMAAGPPARCAWCFGDPGVAGVLASVGADAGDSKLIGFAEHHMESAARRVDVDTQLTDAGLCHGSSGIAHIFNRVGQRAKSAAYVDVAKRWFERSITYRTTNPKLAGFQFRWSDSSGPIPGLLYGASGLGLTLLGAASDLDPIWDRVLTLSM